MCVLTKKLRDCGNPPIHCLHIIYASVEIYLKRPIRLFILKWHQYYRRLTV